MCVIVIHFCSRVKLFNFLSFQLLAYCFNTQFIAVCAFKLLRLRLDEMSKKGKGEIISATKYHVHLSCILYTLYLHTCTHLCAYVMCWMYINELYVHLQSVSVVHSPYKTNMKTTSSHQIFWYKSIVIGYMVIVVWRHQCNC